jgi:uncharacterized protein
MPGKRIRPMNLLLGILAGVFLLGCVPVILQNKMIYFPVRYDSALKPGGPGMEKFHPYTTADGKTQYGWLIQPTRTSENPGKRPDFYITFNGNAATALGMIEYYEGMAKKTGCGFFLMDYRGYGFNEGSPNEGAIENDVIGAYDTLKSEGLLDHGVGLIGHSLGGGAAFALAVNRPVDRIITISTFTSIDAMAREVIIWPIYYFCFNHFPNDERLAELLARPDSERPREIILLHAKLDEIIPFHMGEALAATPGTEAPGSGFEFIPLENAGHNDAPDAAFDELVEILNRSSEPQAP